MIFSSRAIATDLYPDLLGSRRGDRRRRESAFGMPDDESNEVVPVERFSVTSDVSKDGGPPRRVVSRQNDERDVAKTRVGDLLDAKRRAVHDRHAEIEENEAGLQAVAQMTQRFSAVGCRDDGVAVHFKKVPCRRP
ncbi:MAG TPA: hypothetical protein VKA21_03305 [Candidatus Binatia bacterium]|nr:hypothetical protein [Candidatus Binatia bacterium]